MCEMRLRGEGSMSEVFGVTRRHASNAFAQRYFVFHVRRRMHVVLWHFREFEQQPSAMFSLEHFSIRVHKRCFSKQRRLTSLMIRFRAQSMYRYERVWVYAGKWSDAKSLALRRGACYIGEDIGQNKEIVKLFRAVFSSAWAFKRSVSLPSLLDMVSRVESVNKMCEEIRSPQSHRLLLEKV